MVIRKENHYVSEPVDPTGIGSALDLFAKKIQCKRRQKKGFTLHTIYAPWRHSPILHSGTQSFTSSHREHTVIWKQAYWFPLNLE
jgi:hypothetical protein